MNQSEEQTESRCTCDEPYKTQLCPVHFKEEDIKKLYKQPMILTDNDMVPGKMIKLEGHGFICHHCKTGLLPYMKFCFNCGKEMIVQSTEINGLIENLQERLKRM